MPTLTNTRGEVIDLMTGEVVGQAEGAPAQPGGTPVDPRATGLELPAPEGKTAQGLINNFSWGFNSALFALPDFVAKKIGQGLGMEEEQVATLAKFFNKGERTPVNAAERYSRAVGEGVGGTLPFTGLLAFAAKTTPMVKAAEPGAGMLKSIANSAIQYAQKSPMAAAATDIAFGAGYEGLRQAVEENMDESNPYKDVYKDLLPAAAFMGLPLAAASLPSVKAAGWTMDKIKGAQGGLGEIEKEAIAGLPRGYRLPIVNIIPNVLVKRAESKLAQVFGPINESLEAQQALKQLEAALADPRIAEAGFMFDVSERTMYSPLLSRKAELLEQLGPKELESVKARINQNQQKLATLFDSFSPDARKPIEEAFMAAQQERQNFFEGLLRQKKDMTDAEVTALSERLGPQNIDMLNNELRGAIMADMEADFGMRQKVLSRLGLKRATNPDGTLADTRFREGPDAGKTLPQYPAYDIEEAARALVAKYTPARATGAKGGPMPEPIKILQNMVQATDKARQEALKQATESLINQRVNEQLLGLGKTREDLPADLYTNLVNQVRELVTAPGSKKSAKALAGSIGEINLLKSAGFKTNVAKGEVPVSTGIYGKSITVNPEQIRADAELIAREGTNIDINVPEALDLLAAAQRSRHDAVNSFNSSLMSGRGTRISDAQLKLDRGNAGYKDIEELVLGSVPKVSREYETMKMALDDYNAGYEKRLPLLMTSQKAGGREFLLPNEDLMRTAFKTAENLRQLNVTLGNNPAAEGLFTNGAIDWLRSKGAVGQDGLVDPKRIKSILDNNKNIVEALPAPIQQRLRDEVANADDFAKRMGDLDRRRVDATNNELDSLLAKASRPDADPQQILVTALRDPATMRVLVDQIGKDPEGLGALRRQIWDMATSGAQGGGDLGSFLRNNEKSLAVLFKNTAHLNDLKTLADLQRRVNAFADVTGQIPAFDSLDESLKKVFGFGIQFGTTTMREAANNRISPSTGALALMLRMTGSIENQLYQRIFTKALEDPEFAKSITHVGTPADAKKVAGMLQNIGISPTKYVPNPARIAGLEASQLAQGEEANTSTPSRSSTAAQMLRQLPPAPQTRGLPNLRMGPPPAAPAAPAAPNLMYPTLFPNDPISQLLQQRQQQVGAPQ
jgi:hypothetical protein